MFSPDSALPIRRPRRAAFTIVELLVVMAALSILALLLFPLFSRVRELGYRAQCAGNMRQFATAFALYSLDWQGFWPCPGGLVGDRAYWAQSGNGGLQPYVRQRGLGTIWCCPKLTDWHGKYPARSYCMNSYLRDPPDWPYPSCTTILCGVNLGKLTRPVQTVLLYEGVPQSAELQDKVCTEDEIYAMYRCANWTWARGFTNSIKWWGGYNKRVVGPGKPWHGKLNNYLYCDGHIAARAPGQMVHVELSTYSEMRQWFVSKQYFEEVYERAWSRYVPRD